MEPIPNLCVKVVRARNLAATEEGGSAAPVSTWAFIAMGIFGVHVGLLELIHAFLLFLVDLVLIRCFVVEQYVKISVGNVTRVAAKTHVIPNDLNPEWNRVFVFSKDKINGPFLEISVWDADTVGANDCLGALSFLVEEIPSREPTDSPLAPSWYKLEERPGKTRVKGELLLALWMGNRPDVEEAWQFDTVEQAPFHSKIYLQKKLWYLRVHIIEAQDLLYPHLDPDKDSPGDRELFLDFNLGLVQTKRVRNPTARGTNPVWNEDILFVAAEPFEELLVVTVKDRAGPDKVEVIGVARIFIGSVPRRMDSRQEIESAWFALDSKAKGVFQGRIHLRLQFEGGYHVFDEPPGFNSCTRPTAKQLWKAPLGVLELVVIGAHNLRPMHMDPPNREGTSAYCVAKYGQKWVRTRTIEENFNPHWNEQHAWDVYNPSTVLTVAIFDNRHLSLPRRIKDTPISKVRIRLSSLKNGHFYTNSYPLLVMTASGIKKMGELECSIRFSCSSTVKLVEAYLQPPLPEMHYSAPIDTSDLEDLRVATMNLVASGLARFAPPLRQEVVQFMLDSESHRWSIRRTKANYYRLANLLAGLFWFLMWVEDVRLWKSPLTTISVHTVFLLLVWYPELLLPTVFVYMVLFGAWSCRFRTWLPPTYDVNLSQGGEGAIGDLDELEEEFNVVSTGSDKDQVLKTRYERLRGFAARIQNFLGTVATQGERLQSLLSWRDPTATSIFFTVCLVATIVLYVTPFWVLAALIGFYVLRHPIFRSSRPSLALTFYRRLPALADRIL